MEENRNLTLKLGDISLDRNLGGYYIDLSTAKIHYSKEYYGTVFDELGVPMLPTAEGNEYYAVNIAQYGFILLNEYSQSNSNELLTLLKAQAACLIKIASHESNKVIWWHNTDNKKYNIKAPWASAMAQGEAISFLLRMHQITGNEEYLNTSIAAANFLLDENHPKRVAIRDKNNNLWLEEYPSSIPSFVLNGFIYALFGLYDLYRVTNDEKIKASIDECVLTLENNIDKFDAGYWSYYDLLKKELVRYYYQKNVHVLQLEVLALLTKKEKFDFYAKKWKKNLTSFNFLLVRIMYRVKPRLMKLGLFK